jgi:SAM-dependent methyltransferase
VPGAPNDMVSAHYARTDLFSRILAALADAGIPMEHVTPDLLAPVDQFHTRGRAATLELSAMGRISSVDRVLDVGGGIGGPARTLAGTTGCRVHVVDLIDEYCRTGAELSRLTGLDSRVTFERADARALPADAEAFDVVWTQHSSMNVDDKEGMYREFWRVLRPGGRFVMHEICAGSVLPLLLPVPWASVPEDSCLVSVAEMAAAIRQVGFERIAWSETTEESLTWFRRQAASSRGNGHPPALGLHLLLGARYPGAIANLTRNLADGRVTVIQGVFEKPVRADGRASGQAE